MLELKIFRFLLKFDRKSPQIYLKTLTGNLLLAINVIIEVILFVLALVRFNDSVKTILSFGMLASSLLLGVVIATICGYKNK